MDGDYVLSRDDLDDVHLVEPDDDDEPAERHVSPNAHVARKRRRDLHRRRGPPTLKGAWKAEEDEALVDIVANVGAQNWGAIASRMGALGHERTGKQCRERWFNHLDPNVSKLPWTANEDTLILRMHSEHGNKWTLMAAELQGRPANAIKNHWNSTLKRSVTNGATVRRPRKREATDECTPPAPKRVRKAVPSAKAAVEALVTSPTSPLSTILSDEPDHVEIYTSPATLLEEHEEKTLFAEDMVDTPNLCTLPEPPRASQTEPSPLAHIRAPTPLPDFYFADDVQSDGLTPSTTVFRSHETSEMSADEAYIHESHPLGDQDEERDVDDYETLVRLYHPSQRLYPALSMHTQPCHVDYNNIQINEHFFDEFLGDSPAYSI